MKFIYFFLLILLSTQILFAQISSEDIEKYKNGPQKDWSPQESDAHWQWLEARLLKPADGSLRQTAIMNGNKITTEIHNFGSISSPYNRITDIVWNGLGYGYEFGPLVGAEVVVESDRHPDTITRIDDNGDTTYYAQIMSDGLLTAGAEYNPDFTIRWGFQPRISNDDGTVEYLTLNSSTIPTNDATDDDFDGRPDSWPDSWYNDNLRKYVWPGALGQGATNADKEAFFVFDDRDNAEFDYYPFPGNTIHRGLGLEVENRIYQWVSPLAEDAIFLIYKISNKSPQDLNGVVFGMWGDPHIGGPDNYNDDLAYFDKTYNMVFAYDEDGISDIAGRVPGYLGYKFLESPGIGNEIIDGIFYPGDGIDNDNDGMIDESWTDGIDNDGDWDVDKHDVGLDGIANTGDEGEGDGTPTAGVPFDITKPGEPNFEITDIDESDMLGLTGARNPAFNSEIQPRDDKKLYADFLKPGSFDTTVAEGDNVFLYASGRFLMRAGEIKRFSIALLLGENLNDLTLNAVTVQQIYNTGYQFAKPPDKPTLTVVPGDQQVTLYWNDIAESSYDPISEEFDFEGYVIYRSTDPQFLDQQTITDANGSKFLYQPLRNRLGGEARFDLDNDYEGLSQTPYPGRGVTYYLGSNTGLIHSYIDSNNVYNGQTYYYAVISYDHGSDSLGIPPSECSKTITYDPTTDKYTFDINTAQVIPRNRVAGYIPSEILGYEDNFGIVREEGTATGVFFLEIVDELVLEDSNKFYITFADTTPEKSFTVEDKKQKTRLFTSFYDTYVSIGVPDLNPAGIVVSEVDDSQVFQVGRDYRVDTDGGLVMVLSPDSSTGAMMEDDTEYKITFTNYPVYQSEALDGELANPIFDGMQITIKENEFNLRKDLTGFSASSQTNLDYVLSPRPFAELNPADYEFRFSSQIIDSSKSIGTFIHSVATPFTIWNITENQRAHFVIFPEIIVDSLWNEGESIFILNGESNSEQTWQITFSAPETNYLPPTDGDLFYLGTDKPFTEQDLFSFTTMKAKVSQTKAKSDLDNIRVVPNPYVATNVIEPRNAISLTERGYRRLYFDNLPAKCTIRIYTTAGEYIRKLEHNSGIDDGKEFWDLLTKDNMEVAYGLYFYHVDAPGIGEKVGKFAIIK